jgi:hypothetical protein
MKGRCGVCEGVRRHLPLPIANGLRRFEDHIRGAPPRVIPRDVQTASCMHAIPLDTPCQRCADMLQAMTRKNR